MIEDTLRQIIREELQALKPAKAEGDHLLTAQQTAELLQVSRKFVYDHSKEFPFTVVLANGTKYSTVKFSYNGIQKYIERKLKLQEAK